jgi:hypothetical protein
VGIRLRQRSGDPQERSGEHHGAAHVAAGAEDGVRPPPPEDPEAGGGRDDVPTQGSEEPQARVTRQPFHPERVEVQPRGARELLLDGVRPTGERDGPAAALQRLGDRERGQDVAGRSAGGDQEPCCWTRRHG